MILVVLLVLAGWIGLCALVLGGFIWSFGGEQDDDSQYPEEDLPHPSTKD